MTWVRVDTGALRHRKLYSLTTRHPRAVVGWLGGLLLAGEQESDGFIADDQLELTTARRTDARLLVDRGLWLPVDGGWQIHDWADYQPSTPTAKQRAAWGREGARKRWHGHEDGDGPS